MPRLSFLPRLTLLLAVLTLAACAVVTSPAGAAMRDPGRPFILWTARDAATARQLIETQPWAKTAYAAMLAERGYGQTHRNLFRFQVMGDQAAGDAEKKYLLSFIGAPVNERPWSDNYLHALRFDVLYEQLTPEERQALEDTFRVHIRFEIDKDTRAYARDNWLPNMQWPRKNGAMLMALALKDEALLREFFAANGGWKYYFDDYIADGRFYNEEFGKQYSNIGEMLLWCRGLERLGLDELGYGYTGKHGATMRRYLEGIFLLSMPSVDLGTDRPMLPRLSMGDAKGGPRGFPGYAFQHANVAGYLADGTGGNALFMGANMNGRDHRDLIIEKMMTPMWLEIAHAKWPDAKFDYFLAQMRPPQDKLYYPTLFWGLTPIDPAKVVAPEAPSIFAPERGFALLRADTSAGFWTSPAPAVGLRLATNYVHSVRDEFSLTGFYAFNRPLYLNRQVAGGYAGTDPGWSNSIRSHSGIRVDGFEPRAIGIVPVRHEFAPGVQFLAASARDVYPEVDQTRALFLTGEYLLDVFSLESSRSRAYQWSVQSLGRACPDQPSRWAGTSYLVGSVFDAAEEQSAVIENTWSITATQFTAGADPEMSGLGPRWFDPDLRMGVRMTMLGEPGTLAFAAQGPVLAGEKDRLFNGAPEPGGLLIGAMRSTPSTMFVALHEPFRGSGRIARFDRIQQTARSLAVAVVGVPGSGINDRLLLSVSSDVETPQTLRGQGEAFTFTGHGYLRVGGDRIHVVGDVRAFRLRVPGERYQLHRVGQPSIELRAAAGVVAWGDLPLPAADAGVPAAPLTLPAGPVSAHWSMDTLRLTTGGSGSTRLTLRNNGLAPAQGQITFTPPPGLAITPASHAIALAPGKETSLTVTVTAAADAPLNQLLSISLAAAGDWAMQTPPLRVAHGVVAEPTQFWPRDFAMTVHAPGYVAKYYYLDNVSAALLLDPLGLRRSEPGATRPVLLTPSRDAQGRETWTAMKFPGFQAFSPVPRRPADGSTRFLADMGQHPHGYRSPFEWRFHEEWILVRYKDGKAGERIAMDWAAARIVDPRGNDTLPQQVMPAAALALSNGASVELSALAVNAPVTAVFRKPAGFAYGEATFYPEGSTLASKADKAGPFRVAQPADQPMAFTYCLPAQFADLAKRWQARGELTPVKPWGQGDMNRASP